MSAPNGNGRNKWSHKEAAAEFHARHNHAPYTMAFNARLEAEARNPALDPRRFGGVPSPGRSLGITEAARKQRVAEARGLCAVRHGV
jgi:hypothetical protein